MGIDDKKLIELTPALVFQKAALLHRAITEQCREDPDALELHRLNEGKIFPDEIQNFLSELAQYVLDQNFSAYLDFEKQLHKAGMMVTRDMQRQGQGYFNPHFSDGWGEIGTEWACTYDPTTMPSYSEDAEVARDEFLSDLHHYIIEAIRHEMLRLNVNLKVLLDLQSSQSEAKAEVNRKPPSIFAGLLRSLLAEVAQEREDVMRTDRHVTGEGFLVALSNLTDFNPNEIEIGAYNTPHALARYELSTSLGGNVWEPR